MNILCTGINYKTIPLEQRELFAIQSHELEYMFHNIRQINGVSGAVILSTCNRVELYTSSLCPLQIQEEIYQLFKKWRPIPLNCYHYYTPEAVRHLFRVASGLESMVIGETEILCQVKKAYSIATEVGLTTRSLHRLFQTAFRVAKSVRTETRITSGATSVGSVAVELAEKIFGELKYCRVLLIGSGIIGEKTAKSLNSRGVLELMIANRTNSRASLLAENTGSTFIEFDQWKHKMLDADIIVSSIDSDQHLLTAQTVQSYLPFRKHKPLFIIDLSVPRTIDPLIKNLEGVFLYNIDNLQEIASSSLYQRQKELHHCESLIHSYVSDFFYRLMHQKNIE